MRGKKWICLLDNQGFKSLHPRVRNPYIEVIVTVARHTKNDYMICAFFFGGGGRCSVYIHTCFFIWTQIYVSVPNLEVGVFPATNNDYPAHLPKTRFAS